MNVYKKSLISIIILNILILFLSDYAECKDSTAKKRIRMKYGTIATEGTSWIEQYMRPFIKKVNTITKGEVKVKLFPGGLLGDENTMIERIGSGSLDFWGGSMAALTSKVPDVILFEYPFLFDNNEEVDYVFSKIQKVELKEMLNTKEFLLSGVAENGWRLLGTKKNIRTIDDLKGVNFRTQQTDMQASIWRAVGANPRPIPLTEVVKALQTNIVEAFDQSAIFMFAASWYSYVSYIIMTNHSYSPTCSVISKSSFEKIPLKYRDEILKLSIKMTGDNVKATREFTTTIFPYFEKAGVKIKDFPEEEKNKFKAKLKPVWALFKKKLSPFGQRLLDKVIKLRNDYRNK